MDRKWLVLPIAVRRYAAVALALLSPTLLSAQDATSIATIPVTGSQIPESEYRIIIQQLDAYLQSRYNFSHLPQSRVWSFFARQTAPLESDNDELKSVARELGVRQLVLPRLEQTSDTLIFKVSLFDASQGSITKTVARPCDCQSTVPSSFPFQKIAELLFDAPEIILSTEGQQNVFLPPSTPLELPTLPAIVDSSTDKPQEAPRPLFTPSRKKGKPWGIYAAGAALVGGGILYFVTRGGSEDGGPAGRLADPPAPPNPSSR